MRIRGVGDLFVFICFVGLLALVGCGSDPYEPVSLEPAAKPIPTPMQSPTSIRLGMAPILSSHCSAVDLARLCGILERKVNRPVVPFFGKSYREINDMLVAGQLDAAVICTGAYADPSLWENTAALLVPTFQEGDLYYNGVVLVQKESPYETFTDLEGASAAFTETLSLTGYLYPQSRACAITGGGGTFFGSTTFSYSHDRSTEMVAGGMVDVAFVDGVVWELWRRNHPKPAGTLRVLETSPSFPAPPVVVSKGLSPEVRNKLREAFLTLAKEKRGRSVLKAMGWSGIGVPDKTYLRRLDKTRLLLGSLREKACISP